MPSAPSHPHLAAWRQLAAHGQWSELDAAFSRLGGDGTLPTEALVLRGETLLRLGREAAAATWVRQALPVAAARHDRSALRTLWNQLGVACFFTGELDAAEDAFERALRLARGDGDDLLVARACNNVGTIANLRGQRDVAVGHYQLAIPAYQRIGHSRGLAETYHNLALTSREQARLDLAEEYERHAIDYARLAGDERLQLMGEIGLAETTLLRGDALLAERIAMRAAVISAERQDIATEADALRLGAACCRTQRKFDQADRILSRASTAARVSGVALLEGEVGWERAQWMRAVGDDGWRSQALAALATFERIGSAQAETVRRSLGDAAL